jgi:DNA-binding PadR family transcriptional regulator
MGEDLVDFGRFAEPAVLILVSLASGPKHGYLMIEDIERISGSRLGPGTLYGALSRLETRGLIEPVPSANRRQPYRLTPVGSAALELQLGVLGRVVSAGRERLAAT